MHEEHPILELIYDVGYKWVLIFAPVCSINSIFCFYVCLSVPLYVHLYVSLCLYVRQCHIENNVCGGVGGLGHSIRAQA